MDSNVLDLKEASEFLGVSENWLQRACKEGEVPHTRFGTKYKFYKPTLEQWMADITAGKQKIKIPPYVAKNPRGPRKKTSTKKSTQSKKSESDESES